MEFTINLLQDHKKSIDKKVKSSNLMQKDMTQASKELAKVSELKKAIKILKLNKKK